MKHFIEELPRHYGRSPQDAEIQRVLENMAARAEADEEFSLAQLFPSTASGWGLALWEEAYGLRREAGQTGEQRRAVILAAVRARRTTTTEALLDIARTMTGLDCRVTEFYGRYTFTLTLTGLPMDRAVSLRDLRDRVALLKPAHLDFWLVGVFPPAVLVNSREKLTFQRLELSLRVRSYGWEVTRLNGEKNLDGRWTLNQRFPGMPWDRVGFAGAAFRTGGGGMNGTLTRDTMWRLNGAFRLDGRKKLNAAITKEEI